MMIIPAALTKSIIFPGSIIDGFANISTMVVLWSLATIALGRGFCSWGCFYGGWDDGFSRVRKKTYIRKINAIWRWMPFAALLLVAITAALTLVPTYCDWICPFKAVTEFEAITSVETVVKTIVFASLFLGLVIVLPILTRKRTQCSFLCPLGAVNSLSNKINPFVVKIDKNLCTDCMKCVDACPLFALTREGVKNGEVSMLCSKCGKCVDVCSQHAIHFGIRGVPVGRMVRFSRNTFLFVSYLFLAVFSAGSIYSLIQGILNYIFKMIIG
jgi:polyferredoxin